MNRCRACWTVLSGSLLVLVVTGCQSPYHADRGALAGGLLGAGTGAIIGDAVGGKALPGAAIGAGVGALSGGLIGQGMDETEARNRAMIAQQMTPTGTVTIDDVVAMTQAGVAEEVIVNQIRAEGVAAPLQTGDLIRLQQQGVSPRVIAAMQTPPRVRQAPVIVQQPPPPPVIVEEYHYDPFWPSPYCRHHHFHPRPRPGVSWGISVHE